jgi:hypothetical protein
MAIKTDKTKFYTVTSVCVSGGETDVVTWKPLYLTLDEAAKAVADAVNETLLMENREANVKADKCEKGYSLFTGGGQLHITITAHPRPFGLLYMDCDNMEQTLDLFPDKKSAEQAVSERAKQGLKNLGYDTPEHIYANRNGDCELEDSESIKSEEPYITVDTLDGNHITWDARQI